MPTVISQYLEKDIFKLVSRVASEQGVRAFTIGGYVRDCFLGRPSNDIDIVVEGSGIDFARAVGEAAGKGVSYFKNFGTAMMHYDGDEIEFVGARKESYRRESRKPIVEDGTLRDDQLRRDFTINAMAFSLNEDSFGELVDPFGGIKDLAAGIIRTPLDPDTTYSDDPLRMLRAIRFATKLSTPALEFKIVRESMESMRRMAGRLEILSKERIAEELNKMLLCSVPSKAFRLMDEAGLLPYILPELSALKGLEIVDGKGHKEIFSHTLAVLDNLAEADVSAVFEKPNSLGSTGGEPKLWLRWAALLHDIGKPAVKKYVPGTGWTFHGHDLVSSRMVPKVFASLKLPKDEKLRYVKKLVWLHMRPMALVDDEVSDSAVRRLLFDAGDDIDDLMLLCHADITSKNPEKVRRIHANFDLVQQKLIEVEAKDAIRNFKNPISGDYIMELYGIEPCNTIGEIKEYVKNAILDGEIGNNFEEAEVLMRKKAAELGLKPCK